MITFFTVPRPFVGPFDFIQRNSILSWNRLDPRPQIILFDCERIAVAQELGIQAQKIACHGKVPQVKVVIETAKRLADNDILAFVNADNIFLDDLLPVVKEVEVQLDEFVIIGRRWNLDIVRLLSFADDWQGLLRADLARRGEHHGTSGIDYLIFRGNPWAHMPPFVIGRDFYDNWMVREAVLQKIPVVDVTWSVVMIHQNHPVKPGIHADEIEHNRSMAGLERKWTIKDATHHFTDGVLL